MPSLSTVQLAEWVILGLALVVSVVTDLRDRRILDVVTYPAVGLCLGLRAWTGGVGDLESGLVSGLVAAGGALAVFVPLAWRGKMGWGDAKLMAVVGAALGYPLVVAAVVFTSLAGALQAVAVLVRRAPGRHIPYGLAIAAGTFSAMWWERSGMK